MSVQYASQSTIRVNEACQRCRRNKSRCDAFRPCSLCLRSNTECIPREQMEPVRKKARVLDTGAVCRSDAETTPMTAIQVKQRLDNASVPSSTRNDEVPQDSNARLNVTASPLDHGEAESTMGLTRRILQLDRESSTDMITSAIPDGHDPDMVSKEQQHQRSAIASVLGWSLPSMETIESLIEEYFVSVHWFSLIIYEAKFRTQLLTMRDGCVHPSQKRFLLLLSTVLAVAAWYRSKRTPQNSTRPGEDWSSLKSQLLQNVESQILFVLDQPSLTSVQISTLLGSFYIYHGKPNLSFSLLGSTLRMAQTIRLNREATQGTFDDREERKRVWWTIYTWDRFASITYGRPLGINDQDCNTAMPVDVLESPYFSRTSDDQNEGATCYSTYQRELSKLYKLASPLIERIFGIRSANGEDATQRDLYYCLFPGVSKAFNEWWRMLPSHLRATLDQDIGPAASRKEKTYRLQALSLQLTYDSLLIVFHRPLLTDTAHPFLGFSPSDTHGFATLSRPQSSVSSSVRSEDLWPPNPALLARNTEQWWSAAIRTSRITDMRQLAQLAADSHLVAFLAINLFNSAVVMVVCAMSDSLSDRAQEAKRYITRIYRLQRSLGERFALPRQSSVVLKDLIRLLIRQEEEAMLASLHSVEAVDWATAERTNPPVDQHAVPTEGAVQTLLFESYEDSDYHLDCEDAAAQKLVDEAGRLNKSLGSVQKIFPFATNKAVHNTQHLASRSEQDLQNLNIQVGPLDSSWPGHHDAASAESGGGDDALYWIWDSMDSNLIG